MRIIKPTHLERALAIACLLAGTSACTFDEAAAGAGGTGSGSGSGGAPPYVQPFQSCAGGAAQPPPPNGSLCLNNPGGPSASPPLAVIEHELVSYNGIDSVHVRVTFDPTFVDNTYGTTAVGWSRGHKFNDLLGSDHAAIQALDASGTVLFDFDLDYISADPSSPCGYGSLGVDGGDGKLRMGDRAAILGWTSSLDRNLNERGYCAYTTASPATDVSCTPNPAAPDWDYRVVYEVWLARDAFGPNGFGSAYMSFVHASPSKASSNTVTGQPGECPCLEIDINQCDSPVPPEPPSGSCSESSECASEQFCYQGACIPVVQ